MIMHENGFRHVPVMEDGKPIGVVSARNALDPDMEEFVADRNAENTSCASELEVTQPAWQAR